MSFPHHIFREYDIRGMADTELTDEIARGLGKAFGTYILKEGKKKIGVGHDLRKSSDRIVKALSEGLASTGLEVIVYGLIPTPLLYFSVSYYNLDAGISITGSHNPPEYNGFKLHLSDRPFYGKDIQTLKDMMINESFTEGEGKLIHEGNEKIIKDYVAHVLSIVKTKKKLKVVVDAGHAMGCLAAPEMIKEMGHELIELYTNLDSNFPDHHPDPSEPENLEDLQKKVLETGADIGIAFDGDADRIGVVDEKGNVIYGDRILLMYARALLKKKPGSTIIGDVKCSQFVYDDIEARGGNAIMWKTGHSLIKAKMKETNAALAGEMSGHVFFKDRWFGFDDAIYSAARMLEILDEDDRPVSEMLADIPQLVSTPELRVDCPDDVKFEVVKQAVEKFKADYKVVDTDGARIIFEDGWGLVRASNTQPVLVMRFEASSEARLKEIRELVESEIKNIRQSV